MVSETLVRETPNYTAHDNGRGSIIIRAKAKGVAKPRMSLYLARAWDGKIWQQLQQHTSDSAFDGACCLELGIGVMQK